LKRELFRLAGKEFDLIIIGAGAYGSCVAWEAASRGFSVALVEKGDFCSATSANHLKMVHGGIRYLQHADVYRVRESSRERSALLKIAPHLVHLKWSMHAPGCVLLPHCWHLAALSPILQI